MLTRQYSVAPGVLISLGAVALILTRQTKNAVCTMLVRQNPEHHKVMRSGKILLVSRLYSEHFAVFDIFWKVMMQHTLGSIFILYQSIRENGRGA